MFKRSKSTGSVISLRNAKGQSCDLKIKFRTGEIHIDADKLPQGYYDLHLETDNKAQQRRFVVR